MKINGFSDAVKNKPNQTLPVVSLSNLPVVSLPALSERSESKGAFRPLIPDPGLLPPLILFC